MLSEIPVTGPGSPLTLFVLEPFLRGDRLPYGCSNLFSVFKKMKETAEN